MEMDLKAMHAEVAEDLKATLPQRSLSNIAALISQYWERPYFGAVPYINRSEERV